MQRDHQTVGSYTDFDDSKWQFANPLPAVEDMVRGCVNSNLNNHQIGEDFYWFTLESAPYDGIHEMTREELIQHQIIEE